VLNNRCGTLKIRVEESINLALRCRPIMPFLAGAVTAAAPLAPRFDHLIVTSI
jgi:hypothetical protein